MNKLLLLVALAATTNGILVARDGRIELYDDNARTLRWTSPDGVVNATAIVTSGSRAAVLDALANDAAIVDLTDGRVTHVHTGETPIAGAFIGSDLYLLERDARTLERIGTDGVRASLATPADPAFLAPTNGRLLVYARTTGELEEVTLAPFAVSRRVAVPPFASHLEADAKHAFLVYPREGKIVTVALDTFTPSSQDVGAVPVDLAVTSKDLAIADPSAKRVWIVEGPQSLSQAVARGFLRGLLGLGIARRDSDFPTGVDRVVARNGRWVAYDSASGALYSVAKGTSTLLAKHVSPQTFAITRDGAVIVWNDEVRRLQKITN